MGDSTFFEAGEGVMVRGEADEIARCNAAFRGSTQRQGKGIIPVRWQCPSDFAWPGLLAAALA